MIFLPLPLRSRHTKKNNRFCARPGNYLLNLCKCDIKLQFPINYLIRSRFILLGTCAMALAEFWWTLKQFFGKWYALMIHTSVESGEPKNQSLSTAAAVKSRDRETVSRRLKPWLCEILYCLCWWFSRKAFLRVNKYLSFSVRETFFCWCRSSFLFFSFFFWCENKYLIKSFFLFAVLCFPLLFFSPTAP